MTGEPLSGRLAAWRLAYHVTTAVALPDIAASGALLPHAKRRKPALRHGWGTNDELGKDLVCLSRAPSWMILKNQFDGQEAAILGFEIGAVARLPGVIVCRINSARKEAAPYLRGEIDRDITVDEVLSDEAWKTAELLVPDAVPLGALKVIVLSDHAAAERWTEQLRIELGPEIAEHVNIRACDRGRWPRFPNDHVVSASRALVRPGVDQRLQPTPVLDPTTIPDVDFDEVAEQLAWLDDEHDPEDEGDLFDQLYAASSPTDSRRLISELPENPDDAYEE